MANKKISDLAAGSTLDGTERFEAEQPASTTSVYLTGAQIKTWASASPTLVTPTLGVATGTSIALGGATIGGNALAVTGTSLFNSGVTLGAALTYGGVTLSNAVTGTGNMVLATTPTLTTPVIGAATGTSLTFTEATLSRFGTATMGLSDSTTITEWQQYATTDSTTSPTNYARAFSRFSNNGGAADTWAIGAEKGGTGTSPSKLAMSLAGTTRADYGVTTNSWSFVGVGGNGASGNETATFTANKTGAATNKVAFNNTGGNFGNEVSLRAAGTEKWAFGNDFNGNSGDNFFIYSAILTHASFYVDNANTRIVMPSTYAFGWAATAVGENAPDIIISRFGAATLQHGAADAASPVAQTIRVQSVVAGTTNTAGTDWTLNGSAGTGTGAGGKIILQTAPAGSTGTAQNALAAALTLTAPAVNMQPSVVVGNQALATNATDGFLYIPTCAGTPTGTPTTFTGRVAMIYDTTNNKFYIYNGAWKGGTNPGAFT